MLETLQQNKVKAQEILQFHPFTIESKSKIEQYTKPWSPECSDLSFVNLFIWGIDGKMEYAEAENCLYIKCKFGTFPIYLWAPLPMKGKPCNYKKAVQLGLDYMREIGTYPIYRNIWTFLVDELKKQVDIYKKEGFPTQFGMREFSIIVREHNNSELKTLMDDWWKQVTIYTMRDQISFPYVLWKNNKPIDYIKSLGINWRWNPRFILYPHKWHINYDK